MTLLARLRDIVGAAHVLEGDAIAGYETDWRQRCRGRALAVARPADTTEVAAVVRECAAQGVPIVPQGGNTGLVLGGVPDASGTQLVLSLARMDRVRAIDPANLTLTVEAGCRLRAVQLAAEDAGLLFPLSLASEGSCTIGGNLATNAGGTQVLRYGNARELCLGLEVVTARGEVWDGLVRPAQGQHRLRPARPLHRQRGHAGRDHRGHAQAASAAARARHRAGRVRHARGLRAAAGAGRPASRPGPHRLRADGARGAGAGRAPLPELAATAAARALDGAARAGRPRRRGACARAARVPAGGRAGRGAGDRRRAGHDGGAIARAVAVARIDPAGRGRARPHREARHRPAGLGDPALRRRHRARAGGGIPRRARGELRPSGRRQPALQRAGAAGRRSRRVPARATRPRSTAWSTTRWRRWAAASAPSTASARSGAASSRATRARSRWNSCTRSSARWIRRA